MTATAIDVDQSNLNQRAAVTQASSYCENEKASSNDDRSGEGELGKVWRPEDA